MRFRSLLALLLVLTAGHLIAQQREFRFDDARPLGQAARDLETAYGWIVMYEDVPVFGTDAKDVTNRIIVPNGSPFGFIVDKSEARQPGQISVGKVIASLLDAYHHSGNPPAIALSFAFGCANFASVRQAIDLRHTRPDWREDPGSQRCPLRREYSHRFELLHADSIPSIFMEDVLSTRLGLLS